MRTHLGLASANVAAGLAGVVGELDEAHAFLHEAAGEDAVARGCRVIT